MVLGIVADRRALLPQSRTPPGQCAEIESEERWGLFKIKSIPGFRAELPWGAELGRRMYNDEENNPATCISPVRSKRLRADLHEMFWFRCPQRGGK